MKQVIIFSIFLFMITSCEKVFHPEEISIGKIEDYDELVSAAGGVYGCLAKAFNNSGGNSFYAANLKGDDLNYRTSTFSYSKFYGNTDFCLEAGDFLIDYNEYFSDSWPLLYQVIVSANNIIIQYETVSVKDEPTREMLGEIFLVRAYCYFRLTRTYGKVPLVDNIDICYTVPKSSFTEIYEFIEGDLKIAEQLLPKNNSSARIPFVTPHRGVAKAILAEVYLSWAGYPIKDISKYALAAQEAWEVIDSADFFGFGLVDDFAHLWDRDHLYNTESVFTLYFANPLQTSILYETNYVYYGQWSNSSHFLMIRPESTPVWLFFFPAEVNFYNNYPSGYRKEITFFSTIYVPNDFPPQIDTGYIRIDTVDICTRIEYRKFYFEPYEVPNDQYGGYSIWNICIGDPKVYLFRYAHTLLTYAEALVRSGQLNEKAYECMNNIRRRAHNLDLYTTSVYDLQPGLSPDAFTDSVVWERAWELCGEPEGRWFDLVRLEKVEDLPLLRHPNEGGPPEYPVTKDDYFFPVPDKDQFLNPNLGE